MILVSAIFRSRSTYASGFACQLISDTSLDELQAFAEQLGLQWRDYQKGPVPFFEIGPYMRRRAIAGGATAVKGPEFVTARARYRAAARAAELEDRRRYRDWLAAGPDRGPYPGKPR